MGQSRILAVGGGISAFLVALVVAVSCERQQAEPGSSDADTQPLGSESSENAAAPAPPGPPPPPERAFLAQLPPEQTSQLVGLGIDVVAPGGRAARLFGGRNPVPSRLTGKLPRLAAATSSFTRTLPTAALG